VEIRSIGAEDVRAAAVQEIGLDPLQFGIESTEFLACALRRACGYFCPCSQLTLIRSVVDPLESLTDDFHQLQAKAKETLELLVSVGDILEIKHPSHSGDSGSIVLFAAPPAFVRRKSTTTFFIGIAGEEVLPLPDELNEYISYTGHLRTIEQREIPNCESKLRDHGLTEIRLDAWLDLPRKEPPLVHLERARTRLLSQEGGGLLPGLRVLNPLLPVDFYPGRWEDASETHSGLYVARRPQSYGADLWCVVDLDNGHTRHCLDLPLPRSRWRGCDEAWRLQAAIDHERGNPQVFRVREDKDQTTILDFFSPAPMWAHRRWVTVGQCMPPSRCLFSFSFPTDEANEELDFITDSMWLCQRS